METIMLTEERNVPRKRIHLPFPVLKSGLNPVEELAGVFRGGERSGLPSTSSLLDRSKSVEYNERVITDSDYLECYYPKHAGLWSLSDYPPWRPNCLFRNHRAALKKKNS
jgi:hypothetical protein